MFNILSLVFRYLFILIIYLFIFGIIRLIYLDIKSIGGSVIQEDTYLKLINRKDTLPFKVKEVYPLAASVIIGRKNESDIVIKDPFISNQHAQISLDEGSYFLEDLDSANGTYLNGERIMDAVKLQNGDRIKIGQIEFLYVSND
ncbi:FHA domain-containing protein [Geosporobacter ferrireducens]|uniref:FHA domain-containing protein n=1 Tax=Geosporobacter ferrireducens TaxID=1424294 RepID=A0A1D8GDW1_9FIRM|nr:FHA domain-containing protein [Geosporobacter ferrireducens]AOT69097.1 FHA domain-containing protein [Geosporobacter ferrireducens]MTI56771.1 FHA domain-containing protein [Geosporobacter ferrireducens]